MALCRAYLPARQAGDTGANAARGHSACISAAAAARTTGKLTSHLDGVGQKTGRRRRRCRVGEATAIDTEAGVSERGKQSVTEVRWGGAVAKR